MTGTDRPGVDAVVREVAVVDGPVLVADEPVGADGLGVEIDLRAGVERDRLERAGQVLGEQPVGLVEAC